jgi:hypothetical protein
MEGSEPQRARTSLETKDQFHFGSPHPRALMEAQRFPGDYDGIIAGANRRIS